MDNRKIPSLQLLILLFITEKATAFLFAPAAVARAAGQDAWLSELLFCMPAGLLVAAVCVFLARHFPEEPLPFYLPRLVGKLPGKLLAAAYAVVFTHLTAVIISETAQFIHTAFFNLTPLLFLEIIAAGAALYGTCLGIEVIARQAELVFVLFLFSMLLLIALVIPDFKISNFLPVAENGILPIIKGAPVCCAWRGEIFLILMLYPYLENRQEDMKLAISAVVFSTFVSIVFIVITLGVFGGPFTAQQTFPILELARYIQLAVIIERLEILIVIIWVAGAIVKLAVFYHAACISAASVIGHQKSSRFFIIPAGIATAIIAEVLYPSHFKLTSFLNQAWPPYALVTELLLPLGLLIIACWQKRRRAKNDSG